MAPRSEVQIYESSLSALKAAKTYNLIDSLTPEAFIKQQLESQSALSEINKDQLDGFYILLANLFQSITTKGLTTWEIVNYIIKKLQEGANDLSGQKKDDAIRLAESLPGHISIFHLHYDEIERVSTSDSESIEDKIKKEVFNAVYSPRGFVARYGKVLEGAPQTYIEPQPGTDGGPVYTSLYYNTKDFLNFKSMKESQDGVSTPSVIQTMPNVNEKYRNPTKESPNFSAILVKSNNLRSGTKNALELSAFFNLISNIEFSRAHPYFNATFVLPGKSKQDIQNVFKTATLNQFLFGTRTDTTQSYDSFEGKIKKSDGKIGVETNLSVFMTPQTFVNMNEKAGHRDIYNEEDKKIRLTSVHSKTSPFMTLKSFDIDISPTTGLMSFKTGKLSLVLHDRTRMVDIAPFIKPDLFGAFGAEIAIEYGWKHGDAGKKTKNGTPINAIGDFLDSSVCLEKYMITNSQFTMSNSGEIEINLSIAMKGPIDLRHTEIIEFAGDKINKTQLSNAHNRYQNSVRELQKLLESRTVLPFNFLGLVSGLQNIFDGKYIDFEKDEKAKKALNNIQKQQTVIAYAIKILKNYRHKPTLAQKGGVFLFSVTDKISIKKAISYLKSATSISTGWRVNTDAETKGTHQIALDIPKEVKFVDIDDALNDVTDKLSSASFSLKKVLDFNQELGDKIKSYIDSLIGGIQAHDFFYDLYLEDTNNKKLFQAHKKYHIDNNDYVTFGSFLMSLSGTHMLSQNKYDEIQFVFYNLNDKAGQASKLPIDDYSRNNVLNLSSLLIRKDYLEDFLRDLFEKKARVTVESLISQVINKFILVKDNPCYGMQDLFERKKFSSPVKPKSERRKKKEKLVEDASIRLNKIYYGKETAAYDPEGVFVPPSIQLSFDCLSDVLDVDKTICRISVYDRHDNPYQPFCNTFNRAVRENGTSINELLRLENQIKDTKLKISEAQKSKKKRSRKKSKAVKSPKDLNQTLKDQIARAEEIYAVLTSGDKPVFEKVTEGDKTFFRYKDGQGFLDIKAKSRQIMPTATFATNYTALNSASVSTVNEGKLNTVYITRQDRNDVEELNQNVLVDLPLRILPSQASIELLGCPWLGFGQYIFLDFESGTTMDNTYAVTSIKHSMAPGKFTSSATLSYGDVYGKYEGLADAFSRITEFIPDLQIDKDKLAQREKAAKLAKEEELRKEALSRIKPKPIKKQIRKVRRSTHKHTLSFKDIFGDNFSPIRFAKELDLLASYSQYDVIYTEKKPSSRAFKKINLMENIISAAAIFYEKHEKFLSAADNNVGQETEYFTKLPVKEFLLIREFMSKAPKSKGKFFDISYAKNSDKTEENTYFENKVKKDRKTKYNYLDSNIFYPFASKNVNLTYNLSVLSNLDSRENINYPSINNINSIYDFFCFYVKNMKTDELVNYTFKIPNRRVALEFIIKTYFNVETKQVIYETDLKAFDNYDSLIKKIETKDYIIGEIEIVDKEIVQPKKPDGEITTDDPPYVEIYVNNYLEQDSSNVILKEGLKVEEVSDADILDFVKKLTNNEKHMLYKLNLTKVKYVSTMLQNLINSNTLAGYDDSGNLLPDPKVDIYSNINLNILAGKTIFDKFLEDFSIINDSGEVVKQRPKSSKPTVTLPKRVSQDIKISTPAIKLAQELEDSDIPQEPEIYYFEFKFKIIDKQHRLSLSKFLYNTISKKADGSDRPDDEIEQIFFALLFALLAGRNNNEGINLTDSISKALSHYLRPFVVDLQPDQLYYLKEHTLHELDSVINAYRQDELIGELYKIKDRRSINIQAAVNRLEEKRSKIENYFDKTTIRLQKMPTEISLGPR